MRHIRRSHISYKLVDRSGPYENELGKGLSKNHSTVRPEDLNFSEFATTGNVAEEKAFEDSNEGL
jgi:hypothetical protein